MCGRYVSREQAAIEREFNIRVRNPFERVYNAAPSMQLPVIRAGEALPMRWGLVPGWWSQSALPSATINARSEEAAAKPMWRTAVRHARCLVPALGWYEWHTGPGGKLPHFIHAAQMAGLSFAGLWSEWKDGQGETQLSFAILTRAASASLTALHHRMPVVLAPSAFEDWLSSWSSNQAARLAEHVAAAAGEFEHYPVSRYVNAPKHQGERCIEPAG